MADKLLVNLITTQQLADLVTNSGLVEGLQYKNTETNKLLLAISTSEYIFMESIPYRSFTGLISQPTIYTSSGLLEVGVKYVISSITGTDDFSNVGFTDLDVEFEATGTTPLVWINATRVYNITLAVPEVTEFQNTIGNIVFTRDYPGVFTGTLAGAFGTPSRFWATILPNFATIASCDYVDANSFCVQAGYDGSNYDFVLKNVPFEIRVYNTN